MDGRTDGLIPIGCRPGGYIIQVLGDHVSKQIPVTKSLNSTVQHNFNSLSLVGGSWTTENVYNITCIT